MTPFMSTLVLGLFCLAILIRFSGGVKCYTCETDLPKKDTCEDGFGDLIDYSKTNYFKNADICFSMEYEEPRGFLDPETIKYSLRGAENTQSEKFKKYGFGCHTIGDEKYGNGTYCFCQEDGCNVKMVDQNSKKNKLGKGDSKGKGRRGNSKAIKGGKATESPKDPKAGNPKKKRTVYSKGAPGFGVCLMIIFGFGVLSLVI